MLDKDREFRVQVVYTIIDWMDILAKAYTTLDKVQEFLEGSMSEDNLAVVDMVEEAKSPLYEVADRIATLHKLILEEG